MTELPVIFCLIDVIFQSQQSFCRKLCFTLSLIAPKYLLTIINLVVQLWPSTNIFELCEHMPQKALRLFHDLPQVLSDRLCMALPLAEEKIHLSLITRSISHRTFRQLSFGLYSFRNNLCISLHAA